MTENNRVRYAVAGLGHIAQAAVLPAFKHAKENSELVAFISDDLDKVAKMGELYGVEKHWRYNQFEAACRSGAFDALYIALPNDMHKDFTVRAADAGIHVLCEKPMAVSEAECLEMICAAEENRIKLMIAYRLHFEKLNIQAAELIHSGKIGSPRVFNSTFTMQVREGNIRTQAEHGGGPLNDIGIYCINAARYLFRDHPIEVTAFSAAGNDPRFAEIEESFGGVMRFPEGKLASFLCSFGAADMGKFEVLCTDGSVSLDPAYEYAEELEMTSTIKKKEHREKNPKRDQFAPELIHFSDCVLNNCQPRPSGYEGLNDLRVIEALRKSALTGSKVHVKPAIEPSNPSAELTMEKPGFKKPPTTKVEAAGR